MRVLFLTHAYPRYPGDVAGAFLHLLAQYLVGAGVEVRVIAPHARGLAEQEQLEGVQIVRYRYAQEEHETLAYTGAMVNEVKSSARGKLSLLRMLMAGRRVLTREARSWNATVVHAHWWFPSGMSAAHSAGKLRLPLVVTLHGSDVRLARGIAPARAVFSAVARRAAAVTAVSDYLAGVARDMAPGLSIETLPMPVEVDRFSTVESAGEVAENRLLFVGRLTRQKGVNLALDALAGLPGVHLDLVGDGPERETLEQHAASLGLTARVNFLGARPPAELPQLYRGASAVVVPSHEEGLGLVAVEAILCGTPVVAFASGGLVDALDGGRTGTLVKPGDVPALTAAIRELLERPDVARRRAADGRALLLERHAPERAAGRYLELYERVQHSS